MFWLKSPQYSALGEDWVTSLDWEQLEISLRKVFFRTSFYGIHKYLIYQEKEIAQKKKQEQKKKWKIINFFITASGKWISLAKDSNIDYCFCSNLMHNSMQPPQERTWSIIGQVYGKMAHRQVSKHSQKSRNNFLKVYSTRQRSSNAQIFCQSSASSLSLT